MEPIDLLSRTRERTRDTEPDYLFSDREIYEALATAQKEAAEEAHLIPGSVSVTLLASELSIALPFPMYTPLTVRTTKHEYFLKEDPMTPFHVYLGRLYATSPSLDDQPLVITGYLTPANSPEDTDDWLEIPSRFHYALPLGAASHLVSALDADTEDATRNTLLKTLWEKELAMMYRWSARHNRKPRPIRYGGI